MSTGCVFCDIIERIEPAKIVSETDTHIAFVSKSKQMPTHVLAVPKNHVATLPEMGASAIGMVNLMMFVLMVTREMKLNGYKLVMNVGRTGGQRVMHVHVHILSVQR